jgi:hypothetical protein
MGSPAHRAIAPLLALVFTGLQATGLRCELACLERASHAIATPASDSATACESGHGHAAPGNAESQPQSDSPRHGAPCASHLHSGAGVALISAKAPAPNRVVPSALLSNGPAAALLMGICAGSGTLAPRANVSPPRAQSLTVLRI